MPWNDDEIRERLKEIDSDDGIDVSSWEASFIESVCFKYTGVLSKKQRDAAMRIIGKYQDRDPQV